MKQIFSLKKFLLVSFDLKVPIDILIRSLRLWALDCEGLTASEMEAQGLGCSELWLQVVDE